MAQVSLQFLGSGDAFGSGGRLQTCMLLSGGESTLLIDCGATSLTAMKRARVDPAEIEWVVLSHLHGDHFGGLPFLILDGQFRRRTRPLIIAGPRGTRSRLMETMEALFPRSSRVERSFETRVVELEEGAACQLGSASVTPFAVRHASGSPAHALRIEYAGSVIAYSGDTEWTDALVDVARGVDLFVCEAYFFQKRVPYHLDFATLAGNLEKLQCRRIVLTHMTDDMLAHVDEIELEAAGDGAVIAISDATENPRG